MIDVKLQYNKLACDLMPFCENIQYTDRKSGSASTLNIVLNNADGRFLRNWAATKGDGITLNFGQAGGITYSVDKITTSFKQSVVTWNCSSRPRTATAISSRGAGTPPPARGAIVDEKKTRDTLTNIKFSELLKIKVGQTSEDGLFTLDALRCIGACGIAPAISINGTVYPKVKLSDVDKIIKEYRAKSME
jgi:hypothetical protein